MKIKHLFLSLLLAANSAWAGQTITILWPFGMGDLAANFVKSIAEKANKNQQDYNFVVVGSPGAGGSVAVNKALNSNNTLFSGTASFFIRKNLYPNASYDVSKVRVVMPVSESPFALVMSKDKKFADLLVKKSKVTIGVAGYGTTTHAISQKITIPNLTAVPYTSLTASLPNLLNGDLDLTVDQIGSVADNPLLTVIGVTGSKKISNYPLLTELGYDTSKLVSSQFIGAPKSMDEATFREIQRILIEASINNSELDKFVALNYATKITMPVSKFDAWFQNEDEFFTKLTAGMKVE
jgi:tripartite-type tricarboxylate transporter receptor subunit TctC